MNNDTSGVWRFTSSKDALPDLLADLQTQAIIFPFELDYLLRQINKMVDASSDDSACFISGMHKDVVLLPSSSGKDEFDIVINRNHEKLDHVTLLPSKYALQRQLDKWIRKDSPEEIIALFIIELDEFSKVNDVIEHAAGDLLLFQLARRLEKLNTFEQSGAFTW
jgi:GGDEF domain-containing protein